MNSEHMNKDARIFVAGHHGLVGSALLRQLKKKGYQNILTRSHETLDLTRQVEVEAFIQQKKPEYIFLCAAKVSDIAANSLYPATFCYVNLMIAANLMEAACRSGIRKLLYFGCSSVYPGNCPQPVREDCLINAAPEAGKESFALATRTAMELARFYRRQNGCDFISAIPAELYGPGGQPHPQNRQALPALIRTFHEAKAHGDSRVTLLGAADARRDYLYVDDLAEASVFLMNEYSGESAVNVGTGADVTLAQLARIMAEVVGFEGTIDYHAGSAAVAQRPLLDISLISSLGWAPATSLREGVMLIYDGFVKHKRP